MVAVDLAPRPLFAIRSHDDTSCGTQAENRILREVGAEAATIQAKDPQGAENERDPVQHDARKLSQAYAVHGSSVDATNPATIQMANEKTTARIIVLYSLIFCHICSRIPQSARAA